MSEKKMTPSGWKARQGCSDSSIAMSGVSDRWRKGMVSEYLGREGDGGRGKGGEVLRLREGRVGEGA